MTHTGGGSGRRPGTSATRLKPPRARGRREPTRSVAPHPPLLHRRQILVAQLQHRRAKRLAEEPALTGQSPGFPPIVAGRSPGDRGCRTRATRLRRWAHRVQAIGRLLSRPPIGPLTPSAGVKAPSNIGRPSMRRRSNSRKPTSHRRVTDRRARARASHRRRERGRSIDLRTPDRPACPSGEILRCCSPGSRRPPDRGVVKRSALPPPVSALWGRGRVGGPASSNRSR